MKRLLFFLIASISFQAPILSRGCISFLESQGFYKSKYVDSYYEAEYTFKDSLPAWQERPASDWLENTSSWINCDLSKHNDGNILIRPFDNGNTYCNGKLFFSGIPDQNYHFNAVYDKNGQKWSAFRGSGIEKNPYYKNVSECSFDPEYKLYYEIVYEGFDLLIPEANKNLLIKLWSKNFYTKGVKPSF